MTALASIEAALLGLGYQPESLIRDYNFADVLSASGDERRVELAAFTQVPESYRSAAFGVIYGPHDAEEVSSRRALGAPILLSIGEIDIGVWRVGAEGKPRLIERVAIDALPDLFARNADRWSPQSVHRAKSLGQSRTAYQLDFVDLGLLPAIEHEVEQKLDRLLEQVIACLLAGLDSEYEEGAFRTTFRLLAAKILVDRQHPEAQSWVSAPVAAVLDGIEGYYNLGHLSTLSDGGVPASSVAAAWAMLRDAISFRNISSDSLAFVYENTLVSADTRKRFGTHSTPRQVAEYVVEQLDFGRFDPAHISIFEPFAGAGTFLVAALRHLRDQLPSDLGGEERHAFLVPRIGGAEIDSFACEVATLSLILADYPNANGWKIQPRDLFKDDALREVVAGKRIILCNPPWEDFDTEQRAAYPEMAAKSFSKPMAALGTILDAKPDAIGFVLPQGILRQQQYAGLRQRIADLYGRVELTSLPDRIFQRAGFETALLVAAELRDASLETPEPIKLLSTVVEDRDRLAFLASGKVTAERRRTKIVRSGDLWIGQLDELWEHLTRNPRLGAAADVYRGLKWWTQGDGVSKTPREGFVRGIFKPADSLLQYAVGATVYLNMDPAAAMFPGPPSRPWDKPKVVTNVARLSRGPWRMAAAFDASGLVASQAFFGVWSTNAEVPAEALEAIFNSPLTNAFLTEHAANQHFTNELLKQLPLPNGRGLAEIVAASRRYRSAVEMARRATLKPADSDNVLNRLLIDVDAAVLKAYDLPPRIERRLLEFFRGHEAERRVSHPFEGWLPEDFTAFVPLHEYLGPMIEQNRGPWALEAITPAPEHEVALAARYLG